jgi:hypothetical protein
MPLAGRDRAATLDPSRFCKALYGEEIISKFAPNFRQFFA